MSHMPLSISYTPQLFFPQLPSSDRKLVSQQACVTDTAERTLVNNSCKVSLLYSLDEFHLTLLHLPSFLFFLLSLCMRNDLELIRSRSL